MDVEVTGRAAVDAEEAAAAMVEAVVVDMVVAASGAVGVHAAEAAVASVDVEVADQCLAEAEIHHLLKVISGHFMVWI